MVLGVLCGLFSLASPAVGKPLWSAPAPIPVGSGGPASPSVAINDAGNAVLAWVIGDELHVAFKEPGASNWHLAPRLFASALRPKVAIDAHGDVLLVWEHWDGSALVIRSALMRAGGKWLTPVTLTGDIAEGQGEWLLQMNERGDAALVWRQYVIEDFYDHPLQVYKTYGRTMAAASGQWQGPTQITAGGHSTSPAMAMNAGGAVLAAWREFDADRSLRVMTALGSARTGTWGAPSSLSRIGEAIDEGGVVAALANDGTATVGWISDDTSRCSRVGQGSLHAATRPLGGAWSGEPALVSAGDCVLESQLAIDHGETVAVWDALAGNGSVIRSARAAAGGSWNSPQKLGKVGVDPFLGRCLDLCPGPPRGSATLALGPGGVLRAFWAEPNEGVVDAAEREPSGEWSAPTPLVAVLPGDRSTILRIAAAAGRREAVVIWATGRRSLESSTLAEQGPLEDLSLSRRRIQVDPHGEAKGAATRVRLRLSAPARVRVAVYRLTHGVITDDRCARATAGTEGQAPPMCTLRRAVGGPSTAQVGGGEGSIGIGVGLGTGRYLAVVTVIGTRSVVRPLGLPFDVTAGRARPFR